MSKEEQQDDAMVVALVNDTYAEAGRRGMTYLQLCQAVERLHLTALFHRFGGNEDDVADYLEDYGEHVAGLIDNGTIQFVGEIQKPVRVH